MWKNTQWPIGFLWPQGPGFGSPVYFNYIHDLYDDVMTWNHFPLYWPCVIGFHQGCDFPSWKVNDGELWCFFCCLPELTVWHHWLQTLLDSCHCKGHIITISFTISYFDDCHFNRALQINSPPGMQLIPSNRTTPSRQTGGIGVTVHSQRRVTIPIARWTVGWAR